MNKILTKLFNTFNVLSPIYKTYSRRWAKIMMVLAVIKWMAIGIAVWAASFIVFRVALVVIDATK